MIELFRAIYLTTCIYMFILSGAVMFGQTILQEGARKHLALTTATVGIWSFGNALTYYVSMDNVAIAVHEGKYIGIVYLPCFLFLFIVDYFKPVFLTRVIPPWNRRWALFVIPTITLLMVFTNHYHHLFRNSIERVDLHVVTDNGPWFWVHTGYSYLLILLCIWTLFRIIVDETDVYRRKPMMFLGGTVLAFAINVVYVFVFYDAFPIDITPSTFAFSLSIMVYAVWLQKPYRIVPVTRRFIMNRLRDAVLVVDRDGLIMDLNVTAARILGKPKADIIGRAHEKVINGVFEDVLSAPVASMNGQIHTLSLNGESRTYEVDEQAIKDRHHRHMARLVMLRDVTQIKEASDRLIHQSNYDALTEALNRVAFDKCLDSHAGVEDLPLGFITVDVNGMGHINQRYGKEIGDACIVKTMSCLRASVVGDACIGRIGGDSFGLVLPKMTEHQVKDIINRIMANVELANKEADEDDPPLNIGIGYAMRLFDFESVQTVQKEAVKNMQRKKMLDESSFRNGIISILRTTLVERNVEDFNHLDRTQKLVGLLGDELRVPDNMKDDLMLLAMLHDIGKLTIPDAILYKPDKLTEEEWETMKLHTWRGYHIAESNKEIAYMARSILHHHERWDGDGYPDGLKGEEIPQLSRIIAVVDSFDAMTANRVYQRAKSKSEAMDELKRCSGSQFDPKVVEAFERIFKKHSI